jgi:mRNA-degrading endonuclease RelE of RelBE toxin-antitoxin system
VTFEVIHKPTFQNQLKALPKERRLLVLDKLEILQEDPSPHEPLKKLIYGYRDRIYRLRAGDFRVLYTYGNGWVTLLGVTDRKDAYRGAQIAAEGPGFDFEELPKGDWQPEHEQQASNGTTATPTKKDEFARPIDEELLRRLRVPAHEHAKLRGCRTFDELVNANVSEATKELVLDAVMDPDYDRVLQQPDLVTGDTSDLLKFAEGELLGFLLRLDPDQERFVDWALTGSGPTLVQGGPASQPRERSSRSISTSPTTAQRTGWRLGRR